MTSRIPPAASLFLAAATVTLTPAPINAAEPGPESPKIAYRTAVQALSPSPPQTPDGTAEMVAKGCPGFEVIRDKGNNIAHSYGIAYRLPPIVVSSIEGHLDLNKYNGDSSNELPLSATYIIAPDGVIRYAFVDADYRKRAEPSAVIEVLKKLKQAR